MRSDDSRVIDAISSDLALIRRLHLQSILLAIGALIL
jgi:hypothetical protein